MTSSVKDFNLWCSAARAVWFSSYLSSCKQFCKVNGVASDMEDVEVSLPQGSCLGPLLFLMYINDLPLAV